MIVYDLNSGHREYPGYDEIEDRRGGGRGRSRRSDGTYMGYGGAGAIVKNMIPAFPFFPFEKKGIKILYRSAGNRIPVAGLFHITFF